MVKPFFHGFLYRWVNPTAIEKMNKLLEYLCNLSDYWRIRSISYGEYRKTSIPYNDVLYSFAVEDSCAFNILNINLVLRIKYIFNIDFPLNPIFNVNLFYKIKF